MLTLRFHTHNCNNDLQVKTVSSPLYGKVVITLCLGGNVLPQLAGRQAGPRRVVPAAWDPVASFAIFASGHKLVRRQVSDGVSEGAQETVEEMTDGRRESRQLHSLDKEENEYFRLVSPRLTDELL